MSILLRYPIVSFLILFFIHLILFDITSNGTYYAEFEDCLILSIGVTVVGIYLVPVIKRAKTQVPSKADWLIFGICNTWIAMVFDRGYRFYLRLINDQSVIYSNSVTTFSLMLLILGGIYHMLAKPNGKYLKTWQFTAIVVGVGVFWGIVIMTLDIFNIVPIKALMYLRD